MDGVERRAYLKPREELLVTITCHMCNGFIRESAVVSSMLLPFNSQHLRIAANLFVSGTVFCHFQSLLRFQPAAKARKMLPSSHSGQRNLDSQLVQALGLWFCSVHFEDIILGAYWGDLGIWISGNIRISPMFSPREIAWLRCDRRSSWKDGPKHPKIDQHMWCTRILQEHKQICEHTLSYNHIYHISLYAVYMIS